MEDFIKIVTTNLERPFGKFVKMYEGPQLTLALNRTLALTRTLVPRRTLVPSRSLDIYGTLDIYYDIGYSNVSCTPLAIDSLFYISSHQDIRSHKDIGYY